MKRGKKVEQGRSQRFLVKVKVNMQDVSRDDFYRDSLFNVYVLSNDFWLLIGGIWNIRSCL